MGRLFRPVAWPSRDAVDTFTGSQGVGLVGLLLLNLVVNVGAYACFAASGQSDRLKTFILWQVAGSAFGLCVQLSYAGIVRQSSVSFANVWGIGIAFVACQVFAAFLLFHESFAWPQWLGTGLVFAGLVLVATFRA
jgi:multidrug transporter EmrE-like cation transporter